MNKFILVIDPIASPGHLVRRFAENHYEIIALQTITKLSDWLNYQDIPFYSIIESTGNLDEDLRSIRSVAPSLASGFYGISISIDYADRIFNHLFPNASNSIETSLLRIDKYEMIEKLNTVSSRKTRQLKLPYNEKKEQLIARTIEFFRENKDGIVIKPSSGSALSIAVCLPKKESDIVTYYSTYDKPLFRASDFLVQERLHGRQLYINTASYKGSHIVTGGGVYEKIIVDQKVCCLYDEPIDVGLERYQLLVEFATQTLNAVGMRNGLSHIEVVETKSGYSLVEINPRIAGASGFLNIMAKNLTGIDQIDGYVSLLEKRAIRSTPAHHIYQRLVMIRYCLKEQHEFIKKLKTYSSSLFFINNQKPDSKRRNLNIIGVILLKSTNQQSVISDYNTLVSLRMVAP